jgi:hypothetical protein
MKKVLFLAISILLFRVASSQVFIDSADTTRVTIVTANTDRLEAYSQKVLHYKNNTHITMSRTDSGKTIFTKIDDNNNIESAKYVVLDSFNVMDFDIFEDKLYFCGNKNNNISTEAFIAYVEIEELFFPNDVINLNPSNIKYSLINEIYQDSIFSINRIEVFKDNNSIVVSGIGKMYYGKPPYQTLSPSSNGSTLILTDPDEYYLDFFMFYSIKENIIITNQDEVDAGGSPTYALENDFEIFYIPTDTINGCYHHKFAEITETDNKIYLTSVDYSIITDSIYFTSEYLNIYSFDKFTRQQQSAKITLPLNVYQDLGIKTTHLTDDHFAIALNSYNYSTRIQTAYIFKVSPDSTNIFNISNSSLFDMLNTRGFKIYDCEYLPREEKVIVLKKSVINDHKMDIVFYLDMQPNVSYPYYSDKYKINLKKDSNYDICFNDLYVYDIKNYSVTGYFEENMMVVFDTKNDSYMFV